MTYRTAAGVKASLRHVVEWEVDLAVARDCHSGCDGTLSRQAGGMVKFPRKKVCGDAAGMS